MLKKVLTMNFVNNFVNKVGVWLGFPENFRGGGQAPHVDKIVDIITFGC